MALWAADGHFSAGRRPGSAGAPPARLSLTRRRLLLTLAISLSVSTEILFQPLPANAYAFESEVLQWFGYLAECLVMGLTIMLTLTLAAGVTRGWARGPAFAFYSMALVAGAVGGGLLVIPLQGHDWDSVHTRHFWSNVVFWMAIGHGNATIHFLQQRAARAADALHRARLNRVALEQQMVEARLQVLHAQIEPHFLFNALANVKLLCRDDVDSGIAMLRNLGRYLRAALPRMRDAQTTLGQEAELVTAYLAILAVRMGARLRYAVDIPRALADLPFPPMMLLTLAENAVRHGVNPAPQGGSIVIRAHATEGRLAVSVADTGVGFAAAPTGGTGIGLANTRSRLAALHGNAAKLTLEPNVYTGVVATIHLPLASPLSSSPDPEYRSCSRSQR